MKIAMSSSQAARGKAVVTTPPVTVMKVLVRIPEKDVHYVELTEDLERMGCAGLLDKPWNFKDTAMVRALITPNQFWKNTIRGHPGTWKKSHWRTTYRFDDAVKGLARRTTFG